MNMVFEDILRIKRMREQVKEELESIPRGNLDQNMIRQGYWALRTHNLGKKVKSPLSKEETLIQAVKLVQKDNPNFCPKFDENFFDIDKLCNASKKDPEFNSTCFCSMKKKEENV